MSRHGYVDECDVEAHTIGLYRGQVKSAIRGKRGQAMLRDLLAALDSMPEKRLVSRVLQCADGNCCTLGRLAQVRGVDLTKHEDDDEDDLEELNAELSELFNVSECMVREIEYENDEGAWKETPEQRWERMRRWVAKRIAGATP